jgi:hypothetical protein
MRMMPAFYSKRTHSTAREHILQQENTFYTEEDGDDNDDEDDAFYSKRYRMCSLAVECVLLL